MSDDPLATPLWEDYPGTSPARGCILGTIFGALFIAATVGGIALLNWWL